jgi:hypothetical protein
MVWCFQWTGVGCVDFNVVRKVDISVLYIQFDYLQILLLRYWNIKLE